MTDTAAGARPATAGHEALVPHLAMVRRYLFVLGARAAAVDDLAQEAFAAALQLPFADRGSAAAGAFLRAVAKNMLLRERKSASARREVELGNEVWRARCGDGDGGSGGDGTGTDRIAALRVCVEALPGRSRDLLAGAYEEGLGRRALAARSGLAVFGVKSALRRLRAALKACVERRLRGAR